MTTQSALKIEDMVEVRFPSEDNFLKVRETLERIGIASNPKKTLFPSCYILHKQKRYFLVHFKEMFMLDGKQANFSEEDRGRRNTIANLLAEWNLVELVDPNKTKDSTVPLSKVKILSYKDRPEWTIVHKYTIGKRRNRVEAN